MSSVFISALLTLKPFYIEDQKPEEPDDNFKVV